MSKTRVQSVLEDHLKLKDPQFDLVQTGGKVSGSVISSSFKGKSDLDRQRMIWDVLDEVFGAASVMKVGTLLAYTPEEWNVDLEG